MMLTKKINKEAFAWAIALVMGLATFLVQADTQKDTDQAELSTPVLSPLPVKKHHHSLPAEEIHDASIVLDNSIKE